MGLEDPSWMWLRVGCGGTQRPVLQEADTDDQQGTLGFEEFCAFYKMMSTRRDLYLLMLTYSNHKDHLDVADLQRFLEVEQKVRATWQECRSWPMWPYFSFPGHFSLFPVWLRAWRRMGHGLHLRSPYLPPLSGPASVPVTGHASIFQGVSREGRIVGEEGLRFLLYGPWSSSALTADTQSFQRGARP